MTSTEAAAGFLVGGVFTTMLIVGIAMWVLYIVAYWKVFTKMGEPGWKCIIPIYNEYVLYKRTWSGSMFWIFVVTCIVGGVFFSLGCTVDTAGNVQSVTNIPFAIIGCVGMIAACVIQIMQYYYLSRSFGHGAGYLLGLIFLSFIFVLIIAFGSSRYFGPKGEGADQGSYY